MKKVTALLVLFCMLTVATSAVCIPEDVVSKNRDDRQLIVKTYILPPGADPSGLIEGPFEVEDHSYHRPETAKEEQTFEDSKIQTEVVTLKTDIDDLAAILEQLDASVECSKDGYSRVLILDHTTIQIETAGYVTKYYMITDIKQFTGLSRNDPFYIFITTVKNEGALKLSDISWTVTGTGLADNTLAPTSYTAMATYTAMGSKNVATGYATTASYASEIKAEDVEAVKYTATYLGNPVGFLAGLNLMWFLAGGGLLPLADTGGIIHIMK